jgi:hypothetical protein
MFEITNQLIEDSIKKTDGKVYISCVGEEGYPNVTVKKVKLIDELMLEFIDDANSRTIKLMENSPNLIINCLNPEDPFHGLKIKGKAVFTHLQKSDSAAPVRVNIKLAEGFPY